ncbi:MAG: hypothetical protein NWF00_04785 [Candidatus Bathyarchaeota archaeon]|nr:hypothetical protein [Candidatus Bathyarchaeota archaeon]
MNLQNSHLRSIRRGRRIHIIKLLALQKTNLTPNLPGAITSRTNSVNKQSLTSTQNMLVNNKNLRTQLGNLLVAESGKANEDAAKHQRKMEGLAGDIATTKRIVPFWSFSLGILPKLKTIQGDVEF